MQPTVTQLLGALTPNTDEGTMVGNAIAAPAAAVPFKNSLRLTVCALSALLSVITRFLLVMPQAGFV
jgi:hypothetical protein